MFSGPARLPPQGTWPGTRRRREFAGHGEDLLLCHGKCKQMRRRLASPEKSYLISASLQGVSQLRERFNGPRGVSAVFALRGVSCKRRFGSFSAANYSQRQTLDSCPQPAWHFRQFGANARVGQPRQGPVLLLVNLPVCRFCRVCGR